MSTQFLEIEHKFVVPETFDLETFARACRDLHPQVEKTVAVHDVYHVLAGRSDIIFRHRFDRELQQLTLKTRGVDNEVRTEINLALQDPVQEAGVSAFLSAIGPTERFPIQKQIHVFEFADCEIVHYTAQYEQRTVSCVEFEAVGAPDTATALATLERYEQALGFDAATRTSVNLFEMLVGPTT
jgi:hypothetical protein